MSQVTGTFARAGVYPNSHVHMRHAQIKLLADAHGAREKLKDADKSHVEDRLERHVVQNVNDLVDTFEDRAVGRGFATARRSFLWLSLYLRLPRMPVIFRFTVPHIHSHGDGSPRHFRPYLNSELTRTSHRDRKTSRARL